MRRDDGVGQAVNESADPVARIVGVQRDGQDLDVAQAGEVAGRNADFNGMLDPVHGRRLIRHAGLAPFPGIAPVQLVQQRIEAGEVVAHFQRDGAVEVRLRELVGGHVFALGAALARPWAGHTARQQRRKQRRGTGGYRPRDHALLIPCPLKNALRATRRLGRRRSRARLYRKVAEVGRRPPPGQARR
ncbi:hypothetical protein D3C85_1373500 [compost metagenome]